MAVVRCAQGHYYDDEKFSQCPHCGIFANLNLDAISPEQSGRPGKGSGKGSGQGSGQRPGQEPGPGQGPGHSERKINDERTVAFSSETGSLQEAMERTVALEGLESEADDQKTVGFYSGSKGNDFVTGWLVCVNGPEKGRDYKLYHGFNRIGRGYDMTVCIVDDVHISRENHCAIVYDERSNTFSLVPSGGNLVYKGDELISRPSGLLTGDLIRMGASEFEFIAFCREGRVWERE